MLLADKPPNLRAAVVTVSAAAQGAIALWRK
jgi:hypothetical protein